MQQTVGQVLTGAVEIIKQIEKASTLVRLKKNS